MDTERDPAGENGFEDVSGSVGGSDFGSTSPGYAGTYTGGAELDTTAVNADLSVGGGSQGAIAGAKDRAVEAASQAKDRASELAGQVKERAGDLGQRASEAASQARQRVGEAASTARERASAALSSAEGALDRQTGIVATIRANPLPALGIAVGLGLVLAGNDDDKYKARGTRGKARQELRNAVMAGISTVAANEVRSLMSAGGTKGVAGGILDKLLNNLKTGGKSNAFAGLGDVLKDAVKNKGQGGGSGSGAGSTSGSSYGGSSGGSGY